MGIITAYPDKTPASDGDKYLTVAEDGSTRLTTLDTMRDGVLTPGSVDADTLAQSARPQFKIGIISSTTLNSTGNKSIAGVGFKPKLVRFTVLENTGPYIGFSVGSMDAEGNQYSMSTGSGTSQRRISSTSNAITRSNDTATTLQAKYVSMDADGFTINVTTAGGVDVAYEAYA